MSGSAESLEQQIIRSYLQSWIDKDDSIIREHFDQEIKYTECYGPVYNNKSQVLRWFADWNKNNSVLQWKIINEYRHGLVHTIEWFFECNFENRVDCFDGVSLIAFNDQRKVISIREFQSKHEHCYPYMGNS